MDFNYSETFTLYDKNGKQIPLKSTGGNELTIEINKHMSQGTKFQPIFKFEAISNNLKPIKVLEAIRIVE